MIVCDNDVNEINNVLMINVEDRTQCEKDKLNRFSRCMYQQYCKIRDCVNTRKCKSLSIDTIRERLNDDSKLIFVKEMTRLSDNEVFFILDFVEKHFEQVK